MTESQAAALVRGLTDLNYDAQVKPDYSGRGMFGRETIAVITNAPMLAIGWAARSAFDNWGQVPARMDNIGYELVVY